MTFLLYFSVFGTRRKAAEDAIKRVHKVVHRPTKTHTRNESSSCFFFLTDNSRGPSDGWTAGDYKRCYITTARETTFGLVFFRGSNKYATHGGLKVAKDATRVIHRPLISSRDFWFLSPASLIITWTISFLPTTKKEQKFGPYQEPQSKHCRG